MYRNEGELADKSYQHNNIKLETRDNALQEIQNIMTRFDHKLKSISEQPAAQTKENIELINRAKRHRLLMKDALAKVEQSNEDTWADMRTTINEQFAAAQDEALKY